MRTSRKTRPVSILAKRRHTGHPCRCLSASPQPSWQVIRRALRCPQPPAALARPRRGDSRKAYAVAYRIARSGAASANLLQARQPRMAVRVRTEVAMCHWCGDGIGLRSAAAAAERSFSSLVCLLPGSAREVGGNGVRGVPV